MIKRYTRISRCVNVGVAEVCMWLGPSHRQAKHNEKNSGVDRSLTGCGDAQKESENKAFIQVFHPIQSVKSTNKVTLASLRYACGWVRLTGKQSTRENNGVDGVTYDL